MDESISALLEHLPEDDALARLTLQDAISVPHLWDVVRHALLGSPADPDNVAEEVMAEEVRNLVARLVAQLMLFDQLRTRDKRSPFINPAQDEVDKIAASLVVNLASFGAMALMNRR
ncbi:hypothetical protein [Rhizobium sp. P32RR-XVIII]|uniref:hypothetical protein n=1 Tax=Rhizobium sp. P32RR-XVIII TaxID=2726738 RepID=UPI0019816866|nr:hypothetical protein [Rhizobium sp. P32RR-XVIII]